MEYTKPSRYNWIFQFYLRAEKISLGWVGTGRFIFSLNYKDSDFIEVANRIIVAAHKMQRDQWWWANSETTNKSIKRSLMLELIRHFVKSKLNFRRN